MQVGAPWKARIKQRPGRRWWLLCGAPACGVAIGRLRRDWFRGRHLAFGRVEAWSAIYVILHSGFQQDATGNYQFSHRADSEWQRAKREGIPWESFRPKTRQAGEHQPDLTVPAGRFAFRCPVCGRVSMADVPAQPQTLVARCENNASCRPCQMHMRGISLGDSDADDSEDDRPLIDDGDDLWIASPDRDA